MYILPKIESVSSSNQVLVSFNVSMQQVSLTQDDMLVEVTSSFRVSYSWSAEYKDSKHLVITITTSSIFEGGEPLKITFLNYKTFRADTGG